MEVERKYLLAAPPEGLDTHESGRLEQGYLALDPSRAARRRSRSTLPTSIACGR